MERSTVSPDYQQTLDTLSETLRAANRQRFIELLAQTDPFPFVPRPSDSPEAQVITVL